MRYILAFFAFFLIASSVVWVQIVTDTTMTGMGITDSPLKVDTTVIATVKKTNPARYGYITPAQITSDQDDYNPTGFLAASHVRISGDADIQAVTSFQAPGGGLTDLFEKTLINVGSYPIYYPMEHPDGTAANRITGNPGDFIHYPGQIIQIYYDIGSSRWRIRGNCEDAKSSIYYDWTPGSINGGDWGHIAFGSLSGTITATNATTTLPACTQLGTAASATAGYVVSFPKTSTLLSAFGSAHIWTEAMVSIPTLSDGTQTFTVELQLRPSPTGGALEDNNMYGIRYSHGINGGEWELFSQDNAGAEDLADSGVAVAAATRYVLRLESDKSRTEARAYINGTYVGKVEANIPNGVAVGASLILLKSVGSTARQLNIHSFSAGAIYN